MGFRYKVFFTDCSDSDLYYFVSIECVCNKWVIRDHHGDILNGTTMINGEMYDEYINRVLNGREIDDTQILYFAFSMKDIYSIKGKLIYLASSFYNSETLTKCFPNNTQIMIVNCSNVYEFYYEINKKFEEIIRSKSIRSLNNITQSVILFGSTVYELLYYNYHTDHNDHTTK